MKIEIINKIDAYAERISIKDIKDMYINKELISIPEFLQRQLLKTKWFENDYRNCKEYIISCWKNTNIFDSFSVVKLSKLIKVVEDKINSASGKKIEEYKKILKLLQEHVLFAKEVYVCMDGQSRLILGIITYLDDKYNLSGVDNDIILNIDDKKHNALETDYFSKLPIELQNYFLDLEVTMNIVEGFYNLEDIIQALINKQKGFSWTWFQKEKQLNRFESYTIQLIKLISEPFKMGYENVMSNTVNAALKHDVDGDQLALTNLVYFYQNGSYPKEDNIKKLFRGSISDIMDVSFSVVQKYALELFNYYKDTKKLTLTLLINYVALRQLLDNVKSDSKFYIKNTLGQKYKIINVKEFIEAFIQMHLVLSSSKTPHKLSYIWNDISNKFELLKNGYASSCTGQNDIDIENRMKFFLQEFSFEKLLSENIIVLDSKMPKIEEVVVANNFKDVNGNKISIKDLPKFDRSHRISKHNFGTNNMDNLVPELLGENRSRQEENIV